MNVRARPEQPSLGHGVTHPAGTDPADPGTVEDGHRAASSAFRFSSWTAYRECGRRRGAGRQPLRGTAGRPRGPRAGWPRCDEAHHARLEDGTAVGHREAGARVLLDEDDGAAVRGQGADALEHRAGGTWGRARSTARRAGSASGRARGCAPARPASARRPTATRPGSCERRTQMGNTSAARAIRSRTSCWSLTA